MTLALTPSLALTLEAKCFASKAKSLALRVVALTPSLLLKGRVRIRFMVRDRVGNRVRSSPTVLPTFGTLFPKMSISVHCCDLSAVFNVLIFLVLQSVFKSHFTCNALVSVY